MAYIQTTKRLIHVKETLQKLKNQLFKKHSQIITNFDFITVTEIIPEIDINCDEFYAFSSHSKNITQTGTDTDLSKIEELLTKQNQINSKGRKILIRVKDIMELHDER